MTFPERDQPSRQLGHPSTWPTARPHEPQSEAAPPMSPYQARPRRSRAPLVVLAVAVALALMAGTGGAVWWLTRPTGGTVPAALPSSTAGTPTTASPTPEATLAQLDERTTCNAVVPLLARVVDLALAYAKGQAWNRADAEKLHGELMTLYRVAPPNMKEDIGSQASTVSGILSGGGYDRDYVVDSGTRLAEGCRKYART